MKKILSLLLVVILSCSVFACGKKNDDSDFQLGRVTGNTYRNDFIGLSCDIPIGWKIYNEKELLALNNLVGDSFDAKTAERLKNAQIVYDMCATHETNGHSINVNFEKVPYDAKKLDLKKNIEAQFDAIRTSYVNMGYTNINISYQKVKVDGKEYDGLRLNAKIEGVDVYMIGFMYVKGNYVVNVSVGSVMTDQTQTFLSSFKVS